MSVSSGLLISGRGSSDLSTFQWWPLPPHSSFLVVEHFFVPESFRWPKGATNTGAFVVMTTRRLRLNINEHLQWALLDSPKPHFLSSSALLNEISMHPYTTCRSSLDVDINIRE